MLCPAKLAAGVAARGAGGRSAAGAPALLLGGGIADAHDFDHELQRLPCQRMVEVHREFIGLNAQYRAGHGAVGAGKPQLLAHFNRIALQHRSGELTFEILLGIAIRLVRAQNHFLFFLQGHVHDRIIKALDDPPAAHLKLQGVAAFTAVKYRTVFQSAGVVQLDEIAILNFAHNFS